MGILGIAAPVLGIAAPILVLREEYLWLQRLERRRGYFAAARQRARALRRPLVVIGDPDGGPTNPGPLYGDLCVDLTGCPVAPAGVRADISRPHAIPMEDDSAVVCVLCVFELVADIETAFAEVLRVAGDPRNVWVVFMQPSSFSAWLYPNVQWILSDAPPNAPRLVYRRAKMELLSRRVPYAPAFQRR